MKKTAKQPDVKPMCQALRIDGVRIKCVFKIDHNPRARFYVPTMSDAVHVTVADDARSDVLDAFGIRDEMRDGGSKRDAIVVRPGSVNYDVAYVACVRTMLHEAKLRLRRAEKTKTVKRCDVARIADYVAELERLA